MLWLDTFPATYFRAYRNDLNEISNIYQTKPTFPRIKMDSNVVALYREYRNELFKNSDISQIISNLPRINTGVECYGSIIVLCRLLLEKEYLTN